MDAVCAESAGGTGSKRRRCSGASTTPPATQSGHQGVEREPAVKPKRGRKSKKKKCTATASATTQAVCGADLSQGPSKSLKVELTPLKTEPKAIQGASPEGDRSSPTVKGQGKGKGKQSKQRSLRPRKSDSVPVDLDGGPVGASAPETGQSQSDTLLSSKGKGKKKKSSGEQDSANKAVPGKGKRKRSTSGARKKKDKPALDLDTLNLYSDLDDFVEEFEELLSPKRRCLRSSSTEDKDSSPPVEGGAGPSSNNKTPAKSESGNKTTPSSTSKRGVKKKVKSGKSGKTEKSSPQKGSTSARKTGSCASNSGRQTSTSRGSGRAGASRGANLCVRERSEVNKAGGTGSPGMASSGQQQQQQQMSSSDSGGSRPREGSSGAQPQAEDSSSGLPLGAVGGAGLDNDSDESDMNRLQALLEARGLPSHLFGALGPRMHQLLHRTMSGGTLTKVQHLLQGLQATGDEAQQLSAVMEMCQILVMGNEDSLVGFPIKQVVPALIQLLQMEHNFEMMIHASRALTYMMEALPRSSAFVVEGVSVFLEKLQVINCIDVAEQSLSALETLSKRHGKAILQAGGISACLMFLDFFSIIAQRRALSITANCVQSMSAEEFHYIRDSLSLLSGRLSHSDNKSVESVCLCFARLVDNFQGDQRLLKEIAVHDLLTNIQQLLVMSPQVVSTSVFVTVVRMLVVMCTNCPDLAVILLKQKIAETLRYLLTGSSDSSDQYFELQPRTPQELYEIVSLVGELLPRLPSDGLFSVNCLLRKGGPVSQDGAFWQWQDDRGLWHMYTPIDNKIVEAAYQGGEEEVSLSTMGRSYLLDFNSMQQINEDTGTARPVVRKVNSQATLHGSGGGGEPSDPNVERCDSRAEILQEDQELAQSFIQTLFAVLYQVYSSSAGPNIRHKCLQTILRIIYYSKPGLLRQVLGTQAVSSHIACMLASPDLKVVVGALQMANVLMSKLTDVFSIHFRREGVMHQIQKLAHQDLPPPASPTKPTDSGTSSASAAPLEGDQEQSASLEEPCASSSAHMKLSDVLKRKRPPRRAPTKKGSNKSDESGGGEAKGVGLLLGRGSNRGKASSSSSSASSSGKEARSSSSSSKIPFLTTLTHPRTWGRMGSSSSSDRQASMKDMLSPKQMPTPLVVNKEKVRAWIKEQCKLFMEKYFSSDIDGDSHPALDMLKRLCSATKCLSLQGDSGLSCLLDLASIVRESDVSPFEVIHSGLITQLLEYLTSHSGDVARDLRIRRFLHVFLNLPAPAVTSLTEPPSSDHPNPPALSCLVAKLMACLHQLEQFQVKVHDLPGGSSSGSRGGNALKFFTTHQLKCQLQRHPACTSLKQWKGGPVKIDPLALVQAIEKYLLVRGFGKTRGAGEGEEELSEEENSDNEEMEEQMASIMISSNCPRHRLEFLIGDHLLPYNMTVYQAVKQYACHGGTELAGDMSDGDTDIGNTSIWVHTHTIWYRPASSDQEDNLATSPKKTKAESKSWKVSGKKKGDSPGSVANTPHPLLQTFLVDKLPTSVTVQDASLDTIALLRVLHALNRYWADMYHVSFLPAPVLSQSEFISSKLSAKANRQLQDPLIIMTGNLPNWLPEIGQAAPFLFPFDTRQLLFFATTFDRDRAVLRLQQDPSAESSSQDAERVGPRLDRKRREVSRKDILRQAEKVMEDMSNSATARTMLEIHYENEVGTGLGPTLEFYALVSREVQRSDLDLWRGDKITATSPADPNLKVDYAQSACGLCPTPLHRSAKAGQVNKVKAKFKFLGKFMAKALMDSRMLDLPLSQVFYKWLLGQEASLTSSDLYHVDPVLARSFQQLHNLAYRKKQILQDKALTEDGRRQALAQLNVDGCPLDDLDLYFVLPGQEGLELCKGGRDVQVTVENIEEYLQLVLHWSLVEGIGRQLEAFREGFETLFPLSTLHFFYPEELDQLFCGNAGEVWDTRMLVDCCRPDHGYTHDSQAVKFLFEVLNSYNSTEQRDFLQFVTGSPRLPVGGFRSLNPLLTIVRKQPEGSEDPDSYLPSVMTCVNYLKLPDYSSVEVMRERLGTAAREGQLSFHLS